MTMTAVEAITPPRSCLVVPGHKQGMHQKAIDSLVEEIVLDLEDAVPPSDKPAARNAVVSLLADRRWQAQRVAIRINAARTRSHAEDLAALAEIDHPAWSIVLPKAEGTEELTTTADRLPAGVTMQALIESARGLLNAPAIAGHDAVGGIILGYADLAADLGRRPIGESLEDWRVARELIVAAARSEGIGAIDGPFFGLRDARGLTTAAMTARAAGFDGKWAIHPKQVSVIKQAFAPSDAELKWAQEVIDALTSEGASSVDGAMVDEAMARRARRLRSLAAPDDDTAPAGTGTQDRDHVRSVRRVAAPFYDELSVGDEFTGPGMTITEGHAVAHQAIVGDRLRLALDAPLAHAVTGRPGLLAHPMLVCDIAIGQSTAATGRVLGNLFYRGLGVRPVHVGTTLRTRTKVVARRDTSGGRGIVALRVTSTDEFGAPVLDFWRCPLLPTRPDRSVNRQADDDITAVGAPADPHQVTPRDWNLAPLREQPLGPLFNELVVGQTFAIEAGETVTAAPQLARLSLNLAMTHTDARYSAYGERLVYGGHLTGVAAAHVTRALPDLATILVWHSCDHLAPTFDGDILTSHIHITGLEALEDGGLVELDVRLAARSLGGLARDVLDFRLIALMP